MTVEKNRLKSITFFIDDHIYEVLVRVARDSDRPLSNIVRGLIRRFMEGKGCVSQRTKDSERELIIKKILDTDFTKFSPESLQDLRRVSDEGVREFKEGVASLFQGRTV